MKLLIFCPARSGYSYTIQAETLTRGLLMCGEKAVYMPVTTPEEVAAGLERVKPDVVISVGNWSDFNLTVAGPKSRGYTVVPWFVADDHIVPKHISDLNSVGILVTPSQHCKGNYVRSGVKEEYIHVIPEAVDTTLWRPLAKKEEQGFLDLISTKDADPSHPRLDLAQAKKTGVPILYTTGGSPTNKGAQEVMKALASFDKNIPWVYVLKTWSHQVLFRTATEELELAESLGISNRIRYISGEFSAVFMRNLMGICDIYAAPSRFEGFGLPLVEAQMCGKPVITIAATSTQETVLDGKTGFHAQKEIMSDGTARADINDLARYLKILLTDSSQREKMSRAAEVHAKQAYAPEVVARSFVRLLKEKANL